ncbi:MAG: hypothetical protein ACI4OJ_10390 [Lachnospiraceae bacterium]
MFVMQALRMADDLSLYYSIAGMVILARGGNTWTSVLTLVLFSLSFGLACLLSEKTKQGTGRGGKILHLLARFVPVLLTAAFLLYWMPTLADRIGAGIAGGYTVFLLAAEREHPDRDKVVRNLIVQCVVFLFALLILAADGDLSLLAAIGVQMVLIHLFSAILLLRILRLPDEAAAETGFAGINAVLLGIPTAAALVLATPAARHAMAVALTFLWNRIIVPVLMCLLWILWGICYGIVWVVSRLFPDTDKVIAPKEVLQEQLTVLGEQTGLQQTSHEVSPFLILLRQILPFALLVLAAVLIYRFLSANAGAKWEGLTPEPVREEKLSASGQTRRRDLRPRLVGRQAADRVRGEYRKYLRYLKEQGTKIDPSRTSAEILEEQESLRGEQPKEEQLRAIYLAARYDGQAKPEDARLAADLVKQIRRGEEQEKN